MGKPRLRKVKWMGELVQPPRLAFALALALVLPLFLRQHNSVVKSTDSGVCPHRIQPGSTTSCAILGKSSIIYASVSSSVKQG